MKFRINSSILTIGVAISALALGGCTLDDNGNLVFDSLDSASRMTRAEPIIDTTSKYYSKGHYVYVNEEILDEVNSSNSRIEIDLSEQRARLYKTGGGREQLALETQISTGDSSHPSPTGSFRIIEKSITKESNLYGNWVDPSSGSTIISGGDSREPPSNRNAVFRGSKMPYWLRLTGDGVGMHIGYVPNGPVSHGCIRVPRAIQPTFYKKVRIGTPVSIKS